MMTMKIHTVDNDYGERYTIVVRKHSAIEISEKYGFPYSIRVSNANPKAFDLNNGVRLYDAWQTAYKRFYQLIEEYKHIEPMIMDGVDGESRGNAQARSQVRAERK